VTVQNFVIDLRRYITNLIGETCATNGGARTTVCWPQTFASLVDTLALITRHISFLKGGRAAATANVSEFRRGILCLCSK
jgi:hypothetical protein